MNAASAGPAPILILGMHRSGTSCLAGCLEEAGLWLGDVIRWAKHNQKGNNERKPIMEFHESLFAANGGSWDDPPEAIALDEEHRARRDALIAGYPADRVWGFKDPRSLFALDIWREALPELRFIGTFRDPRAVVRSLARREDLAARDGFATWQRYNRRLLALHREARFPLIDFDWPGERYRAALIDACAELELTPPAGGFRFFEEAMRNRTEFEVMELPPEIAALYEALKEVAA
ncbi:MAG: sulfotransferase [Sphingomonadales bacterium]|nr:sulfotransferase [Sphingomonadales bacterium]